VARTFLYHKFKGILQQASISVYSLVFEKTCPRTKRREIISVATQDWEAVFEKKLAQEQIVTRQYR